MPKWTSTSRYGISAINMATVWRHWRKIREFCRSNENHPRMRFSMGNYHEEVLVRVRGRFDSDRGACESRPCSRLSSASRRPSREPSRYPSWRARSAHSRCVTQQQPGSCRSGLARGTRRVFSACQRRRCEMFTGIITPTICRGQRKRLGPRSPYRWAYRWSNNTSAVRCLRNILKLLVGPGEVPRRSDFNHLQCQTSLTALTGAKGIFPRCQTGIVTMPT